MVEEHQSDAKKLILVSHCILNQYSIIHGRSNNMRLGREIIEMALKNEVGIIQLPCPEVTLLGPKRWAQSYEQYDTTAFHHHCEQLIQPVVDQIIDYQNDGRKLMAAVGIAGSPSCAVFETTSADYSGLVPGMSGAAQTLPEATKVPRQGHFMQTLQKKLRMSNIHFNLIELPRKGCETEKRQMFLAHFTELMEK